MSSADLIYDKIRKADLPSGNLNDSPFFEEAIAEFGPYLRSEKALLNLSDVFEVHWDGKSSSLLIGTKSVAMLCTSPLTGASYITRHRACSVYRPKLGIESVNVGLVGNVKQGDVIVRSESACPPAMLFGSQRCNCAYQWASIREVAGRLNPCTLPSDLSGEELEQWVQTVEQPGRGVVLMYCDSQAGMGSGYTEGKFAPDLYSRALLRQLGENRVEQMLHTSIKEGYEALGLPADGRREEGGIGYALTGIVLDWLGISRDVVLLSNNQYKISLLAERGYHVKRVKSLGKIDRAGAREADQRGKDFGHLDIHGQEEVSFDTEISRLLAEL